MLRMLEATEFVVHDEASAYHDRASKFSSPRPALNSMSTDVLSQVLTLIRLKGEYVYSANLGAPWGLQYPSGASHFYFVTEGELRLSTPEGATGVARSGDLVLLPHGGGHTLADLLGSPVERFEIALQGGEQVFGDLVHGGQGARTKFIAGQFRFEGQSKLPVLAHLPAIVHLKRGESGPPSWLRAISHFLLEEVDGAEPGSALMVSRLIDLLVIRALRSWASEHPHNAGWLAGIGDLRIGRALSAIHMKSGQSWSIAELASVAGMSRSMFAQRFKEAVGVSPLRYLTQWRLTSAADILQSGSVKVTEVARSAGFSSDAAFSRAFKSYFGYSPVEAKLNPRDARVARESADG